MTTTNQPGPQAGLITKVGAAPGAAITEFRVSFGTPRGFQFPIAIAPGDEAGTVIETTWHGLLANEPPRHWHPCHADRSPANCDTTTHAGMSTHTSSRFNAFHRRSPLGPGVLPR